MSATAAIDTPRKKLSPRKRAQRIRIVQYAVLGLLVLAAVMLADGRQIVNVFFRPDLIARALGPSLLGALLNTVAYSIGGFLVGFVLGTVLALMKLSQIGPYRWLATAYIEFFRGVPALVTLILVRFGLPIAFRACARRGHTARSGPRWAVPAAYMAEAIRAGIPAVPRGQVEAARSMGMGPAAWPPATS